MKKTYLVTELGTSDCTYYHFKDKPSRWYNKDDIDITSSNIQGFSNFDFKHSYKACIRVLKKSPIKKGTKFMIEECIKGYTIKVYYWRKKC